MDKRQIYWAHLIRRFADFAERPVLPVNWANNFSSGRKRCCTTGTWSRWNDVAPAFRHTLDLDAATLEVLLVVGVRLTLRGVSGSCADILEHKLALWTFVDHDGIQPTDNHAERELRGFVLWRK